MSLCIPLLTVECLNQPEPISTFNSHILPVSQCKATARYKRYRGNEFTRNNRRIVGRVVFYAVRVVLK
jgi:hypothetical protein